MAVRQSHRENGVQAESRRGKKVRRTLLPRTADTDQSGRGEDESGRTEHAFTLAGERFFGVFFFCFFCFK